MASRGPRKHGHDMKGLGGQQPLAASLGLSAQHSSGARPHSGVADDAQSDALNWLAATKSAKLLIDLRPSQLVCLLVVLSSILPLITAHGVKNKKEKGKRVNSQCLSTWLQIDARPSASPTCMQGRGLCTGTLYHPALCTVGCPAQRAVQIRC